MTRQFKTTRTNKLFTSARGAVIAAGLAAAALVAPSGAEARKVPSGNLTANPSFTTSVDSWSGFQSDVVRTRDRRAPAGRHVAKVIAAPGSDQYTIDDAPSTVTDGAEAGTAYKAAAFVRGSRLNAGAMVGIVIRETQPDGSFVGDTEATTKLSRKRYKRVTVTRTAQETGNVFDVYVRRAPGELVENEAFRADAISIREAGDETPPEDPPGGEDPPEDPPSGETPVTTSQIAIITSHEDPLLTQQGAKYRYIIIRDSLHAKLGQLRQLHPEAEILLYKNVAFTLNEPGCPYDPFQGGGISYCAADQGHENWFLHRSGSGNRLASDGYPNQRLMNVGNSGYQQEWLESVRERLSDAHNNGSGARYDGVFMDDTNLYPGHGNDGQISELSDSAYRNAMVDFVDTVSPALQGSGFKTMVNLGMNPWESAQRSATMDVAEDVSAVNREGFIRWGEAGTTFTENGAAPFWREELDLMEDIQARGAGYHAITYGTANDLQGQRYMRATFLLGWSGQDGSSNAYRVTSTAPPFMADWSTDVGTPTGARYQVGQGWRRDFSAGTVVINAKSQGSQSFNLGGSYRQPDGSCASSVTLAATRALVLPEC